MIGFFCLITRIIHRTRFNFGTELVQEGKKETFSAIPLGKLNNAWTYANHRLLIIILVGYCSGKHRVT